jgi:hypothetical protein
MLPGNGSMVAALRHATGAEPIVTGKPDPTMHRESVQRSHAERPIVVGDRLDTDIEGADAVGCDSLLVLTGVTSPAELLAAPPQRRPSYLAADLTGLLVAHEAPVLAEGGATCGAWQAVAGDGGTAARRVTLRPTGAAPVPADDLDALRALCAAAWAGDGSGEARVAPDGGDASARDRAADVVERLGLA